MFQQLLNRTPRVGPPILIPYGEKPAKALPLSKPPPGAPDSTITRRNKKMAYGVDILRAEGMTRDRAFEEIGKDFCVSTEAVKGAYWKYTTSVDYPTPDAKDLRNILAHVKKRFGGETAGRTGFAWPVDEQKITEPLQLHDQPVSQKKVSVNGSANRRLSPRRATDVKVYAHDGLELKKCRLRDISLNGAFVETKATEEADLELVLKIRRRGKRTHCRLPATVIRAEEDGAALMFRHLDELVYNTLLNIVRPSKSKPDARFKDSGGA